MYVVLVYYLYFIVFIYLKSVVLGCIWLSPWASVWLGPTLSTCILGDVFYYLSGIGGPLGFWLPAHGRIVCGKPFHLPWDGSD